MKRIGKYEIVSPLGQGGSGRLYRAYDRSIPRQVAIKVLQSPEDVSLLERFQQEAAATGNLHHPHIVSIYDFGVEDGTPYLVMELLEGDDLAQLLARDEPIPLWRAADIMRQAGEGLRYAHQQGILHRDVTPANIKVLPDGTVKLIDFGIARSAFGQAQGDPGGTLLYRSPEQCAGLEPDARADLFAFGAVYYELLARQHPFAGPDDQVILCNIYLRDPAPLEQLAPDCPGELARAVQQMLVKDREARYQSMDDVLLDTEPVRLELWRAQAATLCVEAAARLIEGELDAAYSLARQALQMNPQEERARRLREEIRHVWRQRAWEAKVTEAVAMADQAVAERRWAVAVEQLQQARSWAPDEPVFVMRLEAAAAGLLVHEEAAELRREAGNRLVAREFARALELVEQAEQHEPGVPETEELAQAIRAARQQDADERLARGLGEVRRLLQEKQWTEARRVALQVEQEFPLDPHGPALAEEARQQQEEQERREQQERQLLAGVAEVKRLLAEQKFDQAVVGLRELRRQYPGQATISALLAYGEEEQRKQKRAEAIDEVGNQARRFAAFGQFEQAWRVLEAALLAYPGDLSLLRLKEAVEAKRAQEKGSRVHPAELIAREIELCEASGRFQEVLRLSSLLTSQEIERAPKLRELVAHARVELAARRTEGESRCGQCGRPLPEGAGRCEGCGTVAGP